MRRRSCSLGVLACLLAVWLATARPARGQNGYTGADLERMGRAQVERSWACTGEIQPFASP